MLLVDANENMFKMINMKYKISGGITLKKKIKN